MVDPARLLSILPENWPLWAAGALLVLAAVAAFWPERRTIKPSPRLGAPKGPAPASGALALPPLSAPPVSVQSPLPAASRPGSAPQGEELSRYLEDRGYKILEVRPARLVDVMEDGWHKRVEVVGDVLAEKGGRKYLFDVKSEERQGAPLDPLTRRMLLEHILAFHPAEVIWLDFQADEEHVVEFSLANASRRPVLKWVLAALGAGLILGYLV